MHRGTTRTHEHADASLREMLAHLNVIEAGIDDIDRAGSQMTVGVRDLLSRLELLAFLAARLQVADVARVTDALEELVLAARLRPARPGDDVAATMRHGVDVLMLMTYDAMRRMHGHPAAELRGATDALLDRVRRHVAPSDEIRPPAVEVAGL
jgi:ethanolamine ammonia-lyase large subunit